MYLEHDLYANAAEFEPIAEEDNRFVDNRHLVLLTDKGRTLYTGMPRGVTTWHWQRTLLHAVLEGAHEAGVNHFRIEGKTYTTERFAAWCGYIVKRLNLDSCGRLYQDMTPIYAGYTLGSLQFGHAMRLELTEV